MGKEDKLLNQISEHLHPGESIDAHVMGQIEVELWGSDTVRTGLLAATPERVIMFAKKLGGFDLESFPYNRLSSFEHGKSMMGGTLSFHASGNNVHMKWIAADNLPSFVHLVRERMHHGTQAAPPSERHGSDEPALSQDIPAQIAALADLRDKGILTEAEFTAKKADLLSRM